MFTSELLYAGLLPFAVSGSVAFALLKLSVSPRNISAASVAAGFIAAHLALKAQNGLADACDSIIYPHEAGDWLPHIVLLSLAVSVLMHNGRAVGSSLIFAIAGAFALAVAVRLLSGNVRLTHQWSTIEKLFYLSLLTSAFALIWISLANTANDEETFLRVPLLILVAVTAALAATLSGALMYGLLCGAVAGAVGGTASLSLVFARISGSPKFASVTPSGAAAILTFSLGSLILLSHYFAELSNTNAALLLIALAATSLPIARVLATISFWQRIALHLLFCLLPLIAVIFNLTADHLAAGPPPAGY